MQGKYCFNDKDDTDKSEEQLQWFKKGKIEFLMRSVEERTRGKCGFLATV